MFSRFNLELDKEFSIDCRDIEEINKKIKKDIDEVFEKYVGKDGVIDGTGLQEEWFKDVKADVFISHSHNDEGIAVKLAAWLYKNFGLISFIDSFVWGSADELLKKIDNLYCKQESGYYDYEKRNFSTNHVHMMLSIALGKIINKSESIFFLNTSESLSTKDTIENKTYSPWIYSEIFTANIIQKIPPERYKHIINKHFASAEKKNKLSVEYLLELDEFIDLDYKDLIKWQNSRTNDKHPLDILYKYKGVVSLH
jgi:hypothetical protein